MTINHGDYIGISCVFLHYSLILSVGIKFEYCSIHLPSNSFGWVLLRTSLGRYITRLVRKQNSNRGTLA